MFLLFYRFAEAQLVKLVSPFLLDAREVGGLGLTTGQVGFANGVIGVRAELPLERTSTRMRLFMASRLLIHDA